LDLWLAKKLNPLTSFADPALVQSRLDAFSEMLKQLSENHSKLADTFYLNWLEIGSRLIIPSSPLSTPKKKLRNSVLDIPNGNIFTEVTKQLKSFLLSLKETEESSSVLRDIHEFFCSETRKKISPEDVSSFPSYVGRFLLGDPETKEGFISLALQERNSVHYMCGHFLETLCKLFSPSLNPHFEKFAKVLKLLNNTQLKATGLISHACLPGLKKCKLAAFEFISIIQSLNSKVRVEELVCEPKVLEAYSSWKSRRQMLDSTNSSLTRIEPFQLHLPTHPVFSLRSAGGEIVSPKTTSAIASSALSVSEEETKRSRLNSDEVFIKQAKESLSSGNGESTCLYLDKVSCDRAYLSMEINLEDAQRLFGANNHSTEYGASTRSGSLSFLDSTGNHGGNEASLQPMENIKPVQGVSPGLMLKIPTTNITFEFDIRLKKPVHPESGIPEGESMIEFEGDGMSSLCSIKSHLNDSSVGSGDLQMKPVLDGSRGQNANQGSGIQRTVSYIPRGFISVSQGCVINSLKKKIALFFSSDGGNQNREFIEALSNCDNESLHMITAGFFSKLFPQKCRKDS
jgi:hypothetical protein